MNILERLKKVECRTVLSILIFWGQIQNYMMRVSLSLIIVAMVEDPGGSKTNLTMNSSKEFCPSSLWSEDDPIKEEISDISGSTDESKLQWDAQTIGLVLGSFSWGYMSTQIIGGRLAEIFGFKIMYGLGILVPGFLMLIHPLAAKTDARLFMAARVLTGIFEGVTWPAMTVATARWVPMEKRSSFIAQTYFGSTFGLLITFPMCGLIIDSLGWEACYYIIFGITLTWFMFWFGLVYNSPKQHPRISDQELEVLESMKVSDRRLPFPWKSILTSPPVWGTVITDIANTWGISTVGHYGPTYLKTMLGVGIKANGLLSGLPMFARYVGGVVFSRLSDFLIRTKRLKMKTARRIFNTISQVGPAVMIILFLLSGCNVALAVGVQVLLMFFNGAISAGHFVSYVDMTPNYAGTLFGCSNTLSGGAFGGIVPVVAGHILQGEPSWSKWYTVLGIAVPIYFVGNMFYVWLVSAKPQAWNFTYTDPEIDDEALKRMTELPTSRQK